MYMEEVVNGTTHVVVIRRKNNLNTPYITCEVSLGGNIKQYLTRFNDLSFEVLFYRALLAQTPEIAQNTLFQHKLQQITEYQRKQREKNKTIRKF